MVLTATRAIYRSCQLTPPPGLSYQISSTKDSAELRQFLDDAFAAAGNKSERAYDLAVRELVQSLPGNCRLLPAKEYRVTEQIAENRYVGIGIILSKADETNRVAKVFEDGPLHKVGGKMNDEIVSVDGRDLRTAPLSVVVDQLRGPQGSSFKLGLKRKSTGQVEVIDITRDVVPIKAIEHVRKVEAGIHYINLPHISASVAHELQQLQPSLQKLGAHSLILDLRSTREGRVHDVKLLADALMAGGTIHTPEGQVVMASEDALLPEIQIALLVDHTTGGTTEWLAGTLQQNSRAMIVGDYSAGEPWAYEGFEIAGTSQVLLLPNRELTLSPGKSMRHWAPVEPIPRAVRQDVNPALRMNREFWGLRPDVFVSHEHVRRSQIGGLDVREVYIQEAARVLKERRGKPAA